MPTDPPCRQCTDQIFGPCAQHARRPSLERYYCYRCEALKTPEDLRQVEEDEVCLYACRQCGAVEGVWLAARHPWDTDVNTQGDPR